MNYDDRKNTAEAEVTKFLDGFAPPRGLSPEAQANQITQIADAFARRLPVTGADEYRANIAKTFTAVSDTHQNYAWPVQSEFVDAMPRPIATGGTQGAGLKINRGDALAVKIRDGIGIPETDVWRSSFAFADSGITPDMLEAYRMASVQAWRRFYGFEAQSMMVDRFGPVVLEYFGQ